jgi:hypothetical protein
MLGYSRFSQTHSSPDAFGQSGRTPSGNTGASTRSLTQRRDKCQDTGSRFLGQFSNSGRGVKLSANILAGYRVLSAVGACPPHDGVRGSVGGERRPDEEVLHYVCARGRGGNEAFIAGGYHREYWR